MLNILRTGDLTLKEKKDKETVKFTCPDCECVFTADKGEYKIKYDYYSYSYVYKKCPCCGRKKIWSNQLADEEYDELLETTIQLCNKLTKGE